MKLIRSIVLALAVIIPASATMALAADTPAPTEEKKPAPKKGGEKKDGEKKAE